MIRPALRAVRFATFTALLCLIFVLMGQALALLDRMVAR